VRLEGWHGWAGTFTGVVLLTVAALPLAALAAWALARWRRLAGARAARAWRVSLAEVGIVYGTVPPVWLILLPGDEDGAVVSLVPLRDLLTVLTGGPLTVTVQIVGNLLVFAAFGLLGPVRWRIGLRQVLVLAASASATLEILQYVLDLGRVTDLDDVVLNAGGAVLAATVSRRWWRRDREPAVAAAGPAGRTGPR
jgi:hypothetical protein